MAAPPSSSLFSQRHLQVAGVTAPADCAAQPGLGELWTRGDPDLSGRFITGGGGVMVGRPCQGGWGAGGIWEISTCLSTLPFNCSKN